mmetsp:Transcript_134764/g.430634  ORF Transcript_134764/g.430634 Transcript_134764/m.430634 type:complete len:204 (-) Transcript_134764:1957-2568(-)
MRAGHRHEDPVRPARREVEDQHRQHRVEQDVGVPRQVHGGGRQQPLGRPLVDLRVRAHDPDHNLVRQVDRGSGLDQEWHQEGRWEGVGPEVLAQRALHGVGLEPLGESRDLFQGPAIMGLHADAHQHRISHVVCHRHIQQDVEHAGNGVEQHVQHFAVVHGLEAHAIGDLATRVVHQAIASDHNHGEGQVGNKARLLAVLVVR